MLRHQGAPGGRSLRFSVRACCPGIDFANPFRMKGVNMRAPEDIGWKKWHKLRADPARKLSYSRSRAPRYGRFVDAIGSRQRSMARDHHSVGTHSI